MYSSRREEKQAITGRHVNRGQRAGGSRRWMRGSVGGAVVERAWPSLGL